MTDNWDRALFDKDLKSILESKLPVSASKITGLQALATAHPKHHNYIVQCITRFIETAPPDYRLAGLYVIDAISRVVHKQQRKREENNEGPSEADGYLKRFAIVLKDDSLIGCFEPCTTKDKDKVKKTLDFWEQGNVYSKDMVQYVKRSFLNSGSLMTKDSASNKQEDKGTPPVDTALLLATLSNIGNGSLSNLNIPGLTPTPPPSAPSATTPATVTTPEVPEVLPPALAKLLGGLVTNTSSPPSSSATATQVNPSPPPHSDPRMRNNTSNISSSNNNTNNINNNNDPRQRNWPIPQGPSIPSAVSRPPSERKSRWGSANETSSKASFNNVTHPLPPQQPQDPWPQRQAIQDPRMAMNNNNNNNNNSNNSYQQPPNRLQYQPPQPYQQPYQQQQSYQQAPYQSPQSYQQQQHSLQRLQPQHQLNNKGAEPVHDPSLPAGCIKVLTRTLFVGPIPDHYEKEDVAHIFTKYGELTSVIVSKKLKGRHNAFLKFTTRASTEAAKYGSAGLVVEEVPVKVNWAFGFGPKKYFNYDRGDSIIPLAELSHEEKDNLMAAPVGGFQGQPVRELMAVEEPEAQYRPEWKNNDDHQQQQQQRGFKRQQGPPGSGANFEEINSSRKRGRFSAINEDSNNNSYVINSPPSRYSQDQQQQGSGFYHQQQQQYDPSIAATNNYYSDHQ